MTLPAMPAQGAPWLTYATALDAAVRAAGTSTLSVATTVSASGALVTAKHNPVNATSGVKAMTLPTGAAGGTLLSVEKTDASTNAVTVTGNVRGNAATTISLVWQNEALLLAADSAGSWWPVAGHKTKASLDAKYRPIRALDRSSLWVYGHSYTILPGVACTAGQEWMNLLKARMGTAAMTTYGVGNSRLIDNFFDVAGQSPASAKTGSTWVSTRKGVVIVQSEFNDAADPTFAAQFAINALTAKQVQNYEDTLTAILALLSSTRVEAESGTTSGTWTNVADTRYSGGALMRTAVQGAYIDIPITVGPSGRAWVLTYNVSSAVGNTIVGEMTVSVDGVSTVVVPAATAPWEQTYSKRSPGVTHDVGPKVIPLTGLTSGAHTIRVAKTDAGTGLVYADAVLVESAEPVPVFIMKDPQSAASGSNVTAGAGRPTFLANRALLHPRVDAAVAKFPNARVVSLASFDPTVDLSAGEGAHPNDVGMLKESELLFDAIQTKVAAYDVDSIYG